MSRTASRSGGDPGRAGRRGADPTRAERIARPVDAATLERAFADTLERDPGLIPSGGTVLVALSGGSDSTGLLHLLLGQCGLGPELYAAHFDHGLRPDSAADASRVARAAERAGVPCAIGRAESPLSSQADFREARYRFLEREARRVGASRIALAHQRDDQIETLLLRLMRGTGLRGLTGIPVRRGSIVRPLLGFSRTEIRRYLQARGIRWSVDPANRDSKYSRARVRHEVLPALKAVRADLDVEFVLLNLAMDAATTDRAMDERAARQLERLRTPSAGRGGVQIARPRPQDYDRAELGRILRLAARGMGFRLGRRGTRAGVAFISEGSSGGAVDLADGLRVSREYDRITIGPPPSSEPDVPLVISDPAPGVGAASVGGVRVSVEWGREGVESERELGARIPLSVADFPLVLRGPRPGDRIRTHAGTRKLKKLLNERRVPKSARGRVPVLVTATGSVVWVAGHAVARARTADREERKLPIGVSER